MKNQFLFILKYFYETLLQLRPRPPLNKRLIQLIMFDTFVEPPPLHPSAPITIRIPTNLFGIEKYTVGKPKKQGSPLKYLQNDKGFFSKTWKWIRKIKKVSRKASDIIR